jgi:hypothetical protein
VLAHAPADRFEGHPAGQALLEELFVHGGIIAKAADRKMRS